MEKNDECVFLGWRLPDGRIQKEPPPEVINKLVAAVVSALEIQSCSTAGVSSNAMEKINISPKEAAQRANMGINRIRQLCKIPGFPAFLSGKRKILINAKQFDEWMEHKAEKRYGFKQY